MLTEGMKYTTVPLILYNCGERKLVVVTESFFWGLSSAAII